MTQHGVDRSLGTDYFDPKAVERRYATNTAEMDLERYLNGFDVEILRRIEAVMYSGRTGGAPAIDERDALRVNNPTKEDVIRTIIEKRVAFDAYFDRGVARAKAEGIDLDTF